MDALLPTLAMFRHLGGWEIIILSCMCVGPLILALVVVAVVLLTRTNRSDSPPETPDKPE